MPHKEMQDAYKHDSDGFEKNYGNSNTLVMELLHSCTKPLMNSMKRHFIKIISWKICTFG